MKKKFYSKIKVQDLRCVLVSVNIRVVLGNNVFRAADHRPKSAPLSKNRRLEYIYDFLVLNQSVISEVYPSDFYKFLHQRFESCDLINISFAYFFVFDENLFNRV